MEPPIVVVHLWQARTINHCAFPQSQTLRPGTCKEVGMRHPESTAAHLVILRAGEFHDNFFRRQKPKAASQLLGRCII
jgi:hypothetical protein